MSRMFRKTKVVCTIGPASRSGAMIEKLVRAGMNVARLNFSYGTPEEHAAVVRAIRDTSSLLNASTAILLDLPGTKLRTGGLEKPNVLVKAGSEFYLTGRTVPGDENRVSVSFPEALDNIRPGNIIFLNDGAIQLKVQAVARGEVRCKVVVGGTLKQNGGVNVP